jgi:hypothetical protein
MGEERRRSKGEIKKMREDDTGKERKGKERQAEVYICERKSSRQKLTRSIGMD